MRRTMSGSSCITSILQIKHLKIEVKICRSSHSANFGLDSTYLLTLISRLFPATHPSSGRYVQRLQVNSAGRVGRGGIYGRFEGRGGRSRGGQGGCVGLGKGNRNQSENGVDISNTTRRYGKEEWSRLSYDTQERMTGFSPRCPLQSYSLVCIKSNLFIVGI